jgi:hypothetical protein
MGALQRKYGVAATLLCPLIDFGATDFEATPVTFAAGDVLVSKDEGAFANIGTLPSHEGYGMYSMPLTATEMEAARVMVVLVDQSSPKLWEDQAILVESYGHASGQHAFDLDLAALTEAQINAQVDTALSDYDGPTKAEMDAAHALLTTPAEVAAELATYDGPTHAEMTAEHNTIFENEPDVNVVTWKGVEPNALVSGNVAAFMAAAVAQVQADMADVVLSRPISNVEPAAFRTLYGAIASLVNRARINSSGDLEVFKTDDSTVLETLAASVDRDQKPIVELDPP